MTFLELDQEEEGSMNSDSSQDERATSALASKNDDVCDDEEIEASDEEIDDDSYTIWEDNDDAYHTISIPSFFATSLAVLSMCFWSFIPASVSLVTNRTLVVTTR